MTEANDDVVKLRERDATKSSVQVLAGALQSEDNQFVSLDTSCGISITAEKVLEDPAVNSSYESSYIKEAKNPPKHNAGLDQPMMKWVAFKYRVWGLLTIQKLSDAIPKIVPYFLINHCDQLLPLIMCAIERHPDSTAACNLALLLPLIATTDEYYKVEKIMLQLVCDPSGVALEMTIKELVPALLTDRIICYKF
ncbi:hypothetical protein POM88_039185 [Heracleum sosnowskyi]|uniref:Uncharacterized protein n=1 Tax=Heracleum sosnowskyi TaxID=360622 RepID=A0AAD8HAR3_9APIA|nr:hypothetical protein POM88_039185 [Heracleum sosnowskyi]